MPTVLITVDALRADHLAQYGYYRNTMPVLDDIADDALRYTNAYANGPHTARSLPSLLTSKRLFSTELTNGPTIATVLQDGGITTAALHSNTAISTRYDQIDGFDTYEDYSTALDDSSENTVPKKRRQKLYNRLVSVVAPRIPESSGIHSLASFVHGSMSSSESMHDFSVYVGAEELTTDAIEWVRQHAGTEFFLWMHYMDPHRPYGLHPPEPEYVEKKPSTDRLRRLMAKVGENTSDVTDEEWKYLVDLYDSELRYTGKQIDRFFRLLRDEGIWEETNLILTADHGEEFYDHGEAFHRNLPYEELIHVPLFVRTTDGRSGTRESLRELIDIGPTVLEFHDEHESSFEGRSLFDGPDRDVVSVGSIRENDKAAAARQGDHKLIQMWSNGDGKANEYYDLSTDPAEREPLADTSVIDASKLETVIHEVVQDADLDYSVPIESEAARRRLRDLGYVE
ncbi:sulfatase [Halosimplex halobium]|uniref:sulfatase n=1 Tax=Halosimplex halobium TaxID=3396618 RepID=UPI003F5461A9